MFLNFKRIIIMKNSIKILLLCITSVYQNISQASTSSILGGGGNIDFHARKLLGDQSITNSSSSSSGYSIIESMGCVNHYARDRINYLNTLIDNVSDKKFEVSGKTYHVIVNNLTYGKQWKCVSFGIDEGKYVWCAIINNSTNYYRIPNDKTISEMHDVIKRSESTFPTKITGNVRDSYFRVADNFWGFANGGYYRFDGLSSGRYISDARDGVIWSSYHHNKNFSKYSVKSGSNSANRTSVLSIDVNSYNNWIEIYNTGGGNNNKIHGFDSDGNGRIMFTTEMADTTNDKSNELILITIPELMNNVR